MVLVRHGQTAWNAERRFLGTTDIPLDDTGHDQARLLAEQLPRVFERVYTSPLSRAHQTASYLHPEPEPIEGLRELYQGELEGLSGPEAFVRFPLFFAQWQHDPSDVAVPGGESLSACQARAVAALEEIAERHPSGGRVVAVTHQMVIATLTCWVLDAPLSQWRSHGVPNTALTVLERSGGRWRLRVSGWRPD